MAPRPPANNWDDSDDESTPPSSPPPPKVAPRQRKFDDEEDDSDVLESWDAEEDSEAERSKAKAAAEEKAKAEALAKANKKSKSQRIEEHRMEKMRRRQAVEDGDESEESEDENEKRQRMRRMEKEADLKNAESLFGEMGVNDSAKSKASDAKKTTILVDPKNPGSAVDLAQLKLFNPQTLPQFIELRDTVAALINSNSKKAQYPGFATEFVKMISKDLSSEQIKKIGSGLSTLGNEKMREEKAAEKGGKKTKAAKSKTTLNASRDTVGRADTNAYDGDGLGDDDFM